MSRRYDAGMNAIHHTYWLLAGAAALVLVGIGSSLVARRFGAPLLLVFLVLGMLSGIDGPGGIRFDDYELTYRIVDRSGQTKWVWDQGCGVYSARDELMGLEGFIVEVARRQMVEENARRRLSFEHSTGLASASMFIDRMEFSAAISARTALPCAIFAINVGELEHVAARFGQDYADRVMIDLGRRLEATQGQLNCAALLDPHVFVVMVVDFSADALAWCGDDARRLAQHAAENPDAVLDELQDSLRSLLEAPVRIEGHEFSVPTRIGFASIGHGKSDPKNVLDHVLAASGWEAAGDA